jgi:tripartite-type tricarboxylate transporter receptor subunit TctC
LSGILAPAGMPKPLLMKINADIAWALQQPDFRKKLSDLGFEPKGEGPDEYKAKIVSEIAKWAEVVKAANIPKVE